MVVEKSRFVFSDRLLGVVGLEIKHVDTVYLMLAYAAVFLTSALGVVIALHHRRRQKEKFEIICALELEIGLNRVIEPILKKAHATWTGRFNTPTFIVVMQISLCVVSACMLGRLLLS